MHGNWWFYLLIALILFFVILFYLLNSKAPLLLRLAGRTVSRDKDTHIFWAKFFCSFCLASLLLLLFFYTAPSDYFSQPYPW
jgi:hypothetical protein